eukprot:224541-Amorphochlora_amoeboformis.AAC.2
MADIHTCEVDGLPPFEEKNQKVKFSTDSSGLMAEAKALLNIILLCAFSNFMEERCISGGDFWAEKE